MKYDLGGFKGETGVVIPPALTKYLVAYENEEAEFLPKPTKEIAEAWLDTVISLCDMANDLNEFNKDLCWGIFNKSSGDFENEVCYGTVASSRTFAHAYHLGVKYSYQCFKGLDKLAGILGLELHEVDRGRDAEYRYEYSIEYKDRIIFQIEKYRLGED